MFRDFFYTIAMMSGKRQKAYQMEVEAQKKEFSKEHPSLTEKRNAAIEYLGDRWLLAQKQERLTTQRSF